MFKKLKDKIAEEISPQRIQQLTQSVTDKLQQNNISLTNNSNQVKEDSFFSLTEEDASPPKTANNSGFTDVLLNAASTPQNENRTRRNSNSSIASDVSFLPRYESSFNYHLQSDLDVSASEIEDNVSQQSSQLGHVSKEQVYSAFTKAQMRYHKYRGRYTDLANHYKELERENAKMKAVLVETQDKAIRRVSELREQCSLSQKAKADLEHAMRTELEEKLIVIGTLKDKIGLLQNNSESDEKLQEIKAQAIVEAEYKDRLTVMEKALQEVEEREKINNLKFAKSKMELHTEIQNRELEITNLKSDLDTVRHELEGYENRNDGNLRAQNSKLIETCENLDAKCKNLEAENLKLEQYKLEISDLRDERSKSASILREMEAKVSEIPILEDKIREFENNFKELDKANGKLRDTLENSEKVVEELKEKLLIADNECANFKVESARIQEETKTSLLHLEEKIRTKLETEFKEQKTKIQEDFQTRLQAIEINDQDSKQVQIKLMESEQNVKELQVMFDTLKADLEKRQSAYTTLETNHLELIDENNKRVVDINNMKKSQKNEIDVLQKSLKEKEEQINKLTKDIEDSRAKLSIKEVDISKVNNDLQQTKKANDNLREEFNALNNEKVQLQEDIKIHVDQLRNMNDLEEKLKTLSKENVGLKESSKFKNQCELLEKDIKKLETNLKEKSVEFENLLEQNETLKVAHDESLGTLKRAEDELKKATLENKTLKENLLKIDSDLLERKTALEEQTKNYDLKVNELNVELNQVKQERDELQFEVKASAINVEELSGSLEKLKDEYSQLQVNLQNGDSELRDKCKTLEDSNKRLTDNMESSERVIVGLKQDLEKSKRELNDQSIELKELLKIVTEENELLKQKSVELESTLIDLKKENEEMSDSSQNAKDQEEHLLYLQKQLEEHNALVQKYVDSESKLQDEYEKLSQENDKMKGEIQVLEKLSIKVEELSQESEVKTSVISEKDKRLLELTGEVELTKEELSRLEEELNNVHELLKNSNVEKQQLFEQVSRLKTVEMQFNDVTSNNQSIERKMKCFEDEIGELKLRNSQITSDNQHLLEENEKLITECTDVKIRYESFGALKNELEVKLNASKEKTERLEAELKTIKEESEVLKKAKKELESSQINPNETDELRNKLLNLNVKFEQTLEENALIKNEFNDIRKELETAAREKKMLQTQVNDLEHHCSELSHERQLLKDEIEELKITPINFNQTEVDGLRDKLAQYKSIDATNRNSIEFYENELQKMRNKNEKLNRKLDETLVMLNHCTDLSASTEIEYLKNVLYNYMLGKESLVMARVLAAVCKFDTQQTDAVLKHEQHKQSLLGQLGIL
ncbi:PREDICTED: golgin subfamily A member 4 [Nicrophorus vespilloides]|uniref:Golgin subfamily A member 4 n=1 Tax=Nicrophorus vespilloides TaxID=110193 RepID=A0ABM1MRR0_NICVS|nr:PREDICTED: golgin subfamily A member 4 [Nicrophorus vespilloides]